MGGGRVQPEEDDLNRRGEQQEPVRRGFENALARADEGRVDDRLVEPIIQVERAPWVVVVPQVEHVVNGHPSAVDLREEALEAVVVLTLGRLLERGRHRRVAARHLAESRPLVDECVVRELFLVHVLLRHACLLEKPIVEVPIGEVGIALEHFGHLLARIRELLLLRLGQDAARHRPAPTPRHLSYPCTSQGRPSWGAACESCGAATLASS